MIWKNIPGYKYPYRINDQGEVQQLRSGAWQTLKRSAARGRMEVLLRTTEGKQVRAGVFQLLDLAFRGGYAARNRLCSVAANGVKTECTLDNLSYLPQAEVARRGMVRCQRKPVIRYDRNGGAEVYKAVGEAAKKNGLSRPALVKRLYHGVLDPRGYHFELANPKRGKSI